jgi:hypothetical protein
VCVVFSWPLAWAAAVAPLLFLALGACLLFRYLFWVPAILVGLAHAAVGALLLAYFAARLHPALRWPGSAIGFLVPFVAVVRMYGQVASGVRPPETSCGLVAAFRR